MPSEDVASWSGAHSCWSLTFMDCVCRHTCAINWPNDANPDSTNSTWRI